MVPAAFEHRDHAYEGRYGLREAQTVQLLGGSCPTRMYQLAWDAAELVHVPPPMVAAVIEAESACQGEAVSSAGARGLMQLIPQFGGREAYRYLHGRDRQPSKKDLHDPRINIELGVSYMGALQGHYYFVNSQLARGVLALAAYNAGPDAVDRRLPAKRAQSWDGPAALEWVLGNTPAETRGYVRTVLRKASIYDRAIAAMHTSDARQARALAEP
jgi:soluble lytic murein transglycosylase-like protein